MGNHKTEMEKMDHTDQGLEGNTSSKPRGEIAEHWCFTWNNYPINWEDQMDLSNEVRYIIGYEVGESGTPHLQGYVQLTKRKRLVTLKREYPEEIHWERSQDKILKINKLRKSRGMMLLTVDHDASIRYIRDNPDKPEWDCAGMKNIPPPPKCLKYAELYDWQKELYDNCSVWSEDDRTIHWYWCKKGASGKSALAKKMCMELEAIKCAGKASDIKYMLSNAGNYKTVIIDCPRASLDYISYTGIEEIKDGCFASTKYECKMVIIPTPHVIVFANELPDMSKMSSDRWNIVNVDKR